MRLLLPILILFVFSEIAPRVGAQDHASEKPTKRNTTYDEIAQAPAKARAKRNPLESDPDAIAAGRVLFEQHCQECHGRSAEGAERGPSLRVQEIQTAEPGAIFWILSNGVVRRGMPDWSKLPEPQRWALVCFIKSLGKKPS